MTTLNYALSGAIARTLKKGDEVLITQLDHEANRGPWLRLSSQGVIIQEVRLLESGRLDEADMAAKITPRTKVMALGASSNALGTVNDIALARRLTREVGALLVIDAVHYAPHFPLDVKTLGMDFLLCSGYKFYGPHVGVLYSRPGALDRLPTDRLSVQDPSAPYRIETGTLNHAAIDGLRAAVDYLASWGSGSSLRERIVDAMSGIAATNTNWRSSTTTPCAAFPVCASGDRISAAARAPPPYRSRWQRPPRARPRRRSVNKAFAFGTETSTRRERCRCSDLRSAVDCCVPASRCTARAMTCSGCWRASSKSR